MEGNAIEELLKVLKRLLKDRKQIAIILFIAVMLFFLSVYQKAKPFEKYHTFIDVLLTLSVVQFFNLLFKTRFPKKRHLLSKGDEYIEKQFKKTFKTDYPQISYEEKINRLVSLNRVAYFKRNIPLTGVLTVCLSVFMYLSWADPETKEVRVIRDFFNFLDKHIVSKDGSMKNRNDLSKKNLLAWNMWSEKKQSDVKAAFPYHNLPADFHELYRNTVEHKIDNIKKYSDHVYLVILYADEYIPVLDLKLIQAEVDTSIKGNLIIKQLEPVFQYESYNDSLNEGGMSALRNTILNYVSSTKFQATLRDGSLWDIAKRFRLKTQGDIKLCQFENHLVKLVQDQQQRRVIRIDPVSFKLSIDNMSTLK